MAKANIKWSYISIPLHSFMVCALMTLLMMLECVVINFIYNSKLITQMHKSKNNFHICIQR